MDTTTAEPTINLRKQAAIPVPPAVMETPLKPERRLGQGTSLLLWEAPEYVVYEKTTGWYIGFGIVLALLLFSAFLLKSFLTAVVFLLGGILVFLYGERSPKRVRYEIRDVGILIENRTYLFRELTAFNMIERGGTVYILLKSRRLIMPMIHVPIADAVDPNGVRKILLTHLPEDPEFVEPFADVLAHWLGF